ncbi:hypothetical protein CMEL01_16397 [Colletotrichum melonis]|uniref:Uncharacterized protein n=1 Tax=Colletotrichum melonis TaxID=1209925 RepID=A0AAI9UDP4_9PEZI|nr:hypothetical protein CMEL01_16397 [Colletotrichum melonis]
MKEPQANAEEKRQEMDFGLVKTDELVTFVGGSEGDGGEDEEPWMNDWEAGQGKLRSWHNRTFAHWIGLGGVPNAAVLQSGDTYDPLLSSLNEPDTPSATAPLVDGIDNDGFIPIGSDPASLEFQKEYRDIVEGSQRATNSSTTGSAPPPNDNIDGD